MRGSGTNYSLGQTYRAAKDEARGRGDRRISTEHFVLALLADPASKPARALGCDLQTARAALDKLDRQALLAIGIDAAPQSLPLRGAKGGRLSLTPAAKAVLGGSMKLAGHRRQLGPEHVLLTLIECQPADPATALFASLGLDPVVIRERLSAA